MLRKQPWSKVLLCIPLFACGNSPEHHVATDGPLVSVDAAVDAPADAKPFLDAPVTACAAPASYATLGNMGGALDLPATGSSAHAQILFTTLGSNDATEALFLAGGGLFPIDIAPGTYEITGAETDFATCSLCFLLGPGAFNGTQIKLDFANVYIATSGTVTLVASGSNAGTGVGHQLTGSIANLAFKKVIIDLTAGTQTDDASGCTSSIGSGGFAYNLQAGAVNLAGAHANPVISTERLQLLRELQPTALTNRYY